MPHRCHDAVMMVLRNGHFLDAQEIRRPGAAADAFGKRRTCGVAIAGDCVFFCTMLTPYPSDFLLEEQICGILQVGSDMEALRQCQLRLFFLMF
jgi:hypothetical protein